MLYLGLNLSGESGDITTTLLATCPGQSNNLLTYKKIKILINGIIGKREKGF